MNRIIDVIRAMRNVYYIEGGCSDAQVRLAEEELGITFPTEYKVYVKRYGAISFCGVELTGLGLGGPQNVVNATKLERNLNNSFPHGCFVLERTGNQVYAANSGGEVYCISGRDRSKEYESIADYFERRYKDNAEK